MKRVILEESHSEESQFEERDLDCPRTNRKKRDSRTDVSLPSIPKQYPHLKETLCMYMMDGPDDEKIYPPDRLVVDVMDAAQGASEDEVVACLAYLYHERGLKPGTRNGPRHFKWFKTVVQDYFTGKRERAEIANPVGYGEWEERNAARTLSQEQFEAMSDAF